MAFKAPSLFVEIDPVQYQSQIDLNFDKVSRALIQIQNELGALSGVGIGGASNLRYTDILTKPDAVIGVDSFVPVFDVDTDGGWTVQITRTTSDGTQNAVISSLIHTLNSNNQPTFDVSGKVPNSPVVGPHRGIIALKSNGAPAMEVVVDFSRNDTDQPDTLFGDLTVWEFLYERTTDGDIIYDLRRVAPVMLDGATQIDMVQNQIDSLSLDVQGAIGSAEFAVGATDRHIIVPYDCEVEGVLGVLGTAPTSGESVVARLVRDVGLATEETIHVGSLEFGNTTDAGTLFDLTMPDPLPLLKVDELLTLVFDSVDNNTDGAGAQNLRIQVRVRRIYHEVRYRKDQ